MQESRVGVGLLGALALVALALPPRAVAQEGGQQEPPPPIYDTEADAAADIAAALGRAEKENRRVLIQWGGNWCGWCRRLHETLRTDAALRRKLLYEYDVVLVDVGRFDKNLELAQQYGADLRSHGVPFLTILDASGKVLTNQETGAFETREDGGGHDAAKLLAFLSEHQAEYWKAQELLDKTLAAAAKLEKRVFLLFGAPW